MTVPALWSQIDEKLLADIVNAPNNSQIKPALQKLVKMGTRKLRNPIQELEARRTFLLKRYRDDEDARKEELSQLIYGYLASSDEKLVDRFAEFAKEERGPEEEVFFSEQEMKTAIDEAGADCDERFLFLHTYAFALLQAKPQFLDTLAGKGGSFAEWVQQVRSGEG